MAHTVVGEYVREGIIGSTELPPPWSQWTPISVSHVITLAVQGTQRRKRRRQDTLSVDPGRVHVTCTTECAQGSSSPRAAPALAEAYMECSDANLQPVGEWAGI